MQNHNPQTPRGMSTVIPGKTTTVTHNLGSIDVIVALYNVATGNELNAGVTILDENSLMITTASGAPDQIRVVIMAL